VTSGHSPAYLGCPTFWELLPYYSGAILIASLSATIPKLCI
jgi:hypothetical protein